MGRGFIQLCLGICSGGGRGMFSEGFFNTMMDRWDRVAVTPDISW